MMAMRASGNKSVCAFNCNPCRELNDQSMLYWLINIPIAVITFTVGWSEMRYIVGRAILLMRFDC